MRKSTCVWLFLAALCGVILFHTSQRVTDGREKIAALERQTAAEQDSIRVLQAEWSYLNQPDRLETLARQYLHLEPMRGGQFATVDGIETGAPVIPEAATPEKTAAIAAPVEIKEVKATPPAPVKILKPPAETPLASADLPAPKVKTKHVAAAKHAPPKTTTTAHAAAPWPMPKHPQPAQSAGGYAASRGFNDVIKSLGVNQ